MSLLFDSLILFPHMVCFAIELMNPGQTAEQIIEIRFAAVIDLLAGIIFMLTTFAEICQLLGIEVLGVTFDPIDILAYGAGVLIAAFIDVKIFAPNLGFWVTAKNE